MKIVMACLLSATATFSCADEVGRFNNTAGGSIVFTDNACATVKGAYVAYAYTKNGDSPSLGCWMFIGREIAVAWAGGGSSIYGMEGFVMGETYRQKINNTQGGQ